MKRRTFITLLGCAAATARSLMGEHSKAI